MATVETHISLCPTHQDVHLLDNMDATMELTTIQVTMNSCDKNTAMTPDHLCASGRNDQRYMTLMNSINQEFPSKHSLTEPDIRNF